MDRGTCAAHMPLLPYVIVQMPNSDLSPCCAVSLLLQSVRAAALANMKQQEEGKKGTDDSSSMQDQQQPADAAAARQSTISSSQCGTLAAAPAAVSPGGVGSVGRASGVGLGVGVGVQQAGGAAARAAELAKAEAAYRALEAEFKEQLHLA